MDVEISCPSVRKACGKGATAFEAVAPRVACMDILKTTLRTFVRAAGAAWKPHTPNTCGSCSKPRPRPLMSRSADSLPIGAKYELRLPTLLPAAPITQS
jgi:hypothetical protein